MDQIVRYENADVLLMDPAYSRFITTEEDTELRCIDLLAETFSDGIFYVVKGRLEQYKEDNKSFKTDNSIQIIGIDTGRIGIYDYAKAISERPELKTLIEFKRFSCAIIYDFSGSVSCFTDKNNDIHVVGISDDGEHDFFTI